MRNSQRFARASRADGVAARTRPIVAPANTNADHGKNTKFERPAIGRMYASMGSGKRAMGALTMNGVNNVSAAVAIAKTITRARIERILPQRAPAAAIDGP